MIRNFLGVLNVTLILFLTVVFSLTSYCQERTGIIRGKITDLEGYPMPGVTMTITGLTITSRSTVTNESGIYIFNDLPAGEYSIETVLPGFKTAVKENIQVLIGEIKVVNFVMDLAEISEDMTVKGDTPVVDIDKASVASEWSWVGELAEAIIELRISPDFEKKLDEELAGLTEGKILYNPPDEMKQYSTERIEVRISQNLNNDLTEGLSGRGLPEIEDILVSEEMKVTLSGDAFKIEPFCEEVQIISSTEPTHWQWDVTALKYGYQSIRLSVSILINLDQYGNKKKSFPVKEKEIYIKINVPGIAWEIFKRHWYAFIIALVAILGLIIAYKRLKLAQKQSKIKKE